MDVFSDVRRVVANALYIFGDKEKMRASGDVTRVFHHIGQQFPKQASMAMIYIFIP